MSSSKVQVISRQAFFSSISQHKKRLPGFTHEKCYQNLMNTLDQKKAKLTFFFDAAKGSTENHFLKDETTHPIVQIQEGSEAGSFLKLLDYVENLNMPLDTIFYFVEDDYLHRPGWLDILLEGFEVPRAEYVTLYDHRDKYTCYPELRSRIFVTTSCHWRTVPSTTHTFAVRLQTLLRDLEVHRRYSLGRMISADHDKFCHLERQGAMLISPMPGWSTHAEPEFASPCIHWA